MKWPYRLVINATLVIAALCVGFGLTGEYGVPGTAVRMAAALAGWWIETRFGGRFALHDSGSPISRWMSPQSYAAFARWFIIVIGSELGLALIGFGLLLIGKGIFGMLVPTIAGICVWVLVARCAWQAVRPNRRSGLPVSCR